MMLIIGARGAGKLEYAKTLGYGVEDVADGVLDNKPCLQNLQNMVFAHPENALALLPTLLGKELILCDEVGSGVIPVTAGERAAREQTGRLCSRLAAGATRVVRVVCGIPQVIKG